MGGVLLNTRHILWALVMIALFGLLCCMPNAGEQLTTQEKSLGEGTAVPMPQKLSGTGPTPHILGVLTKLKPGSGFTCALSDSGRVYCWGEGNNGALGTGTHDDSLVPIPVYGLDDAIDLDVGGLHACAVRKGGSVVCWGFNADAALGDGTQNNKLRPTEVLDVKDATHVATGLGASCAIRKNKTVTCWGRNLYARPIYATPRRFHKPVPVPNLTDVHRLVGAGLRMCAISGKEKALVCFGLSQYVVPLAKDHPVLLDTGYTGVDELVMGDQHTCFKRRDTWRCYGRNSNNALTGADSREIYAKDAITIEAKGPISLGQEGICWPNPNGGVTCRGKVAKPPQQETFLRIALSTHTHNAHGCGITAAGVLMCWGENSAGQLGDGTTDPRERPVAVSAPIPPRPASKPSAPPRGAPFTATTIAAGYDATCALRKNGQVWCWGKRHERKLHEPGYIAVHPTRLEGVPALVELKAGFGYHCGRTESGEVWCWGSNFYGRLLGGKDTPTKHPTRIKALSNVVQLTLGSPNCALRKNGEVWCWGQNQQPSREQELLPYQSKIAEVASGHGHTCVRIKSGSVLCRGANAHGQLGNGEGGCKPDPDDVRCAHPRSRCKPREICAKSNTYQPVKGLTDAVALSLNHTSCALRKDKSLSCWGDSKHGTIGVKDAHDVYAPLALDLKNVREISTGNSHVCALDENDQAWCWGQNVFGVLGDRTTQTQNTPTPIYGLKNVTAISTGQSHTCAIDTEQRVWCWGQNNEGTLGIGITGGQETWTITKPTWVRQKPHE